MIIKFQCQNCFHPLEIDDTHIGQTVDCSVCLKPTAVVPLTAAKNIMAVKNTEKPNMLRHVMKWLTIGWTAFCLLGIGGCSLIGLVTSASQTANVAPNDTGPAVAFIGILLLSIIMWFGIWVIGAIPCAVIWLVGKKNQ